jgi:UDP-N-acetylglucosamine--N-acetylmuramyl-(pentapeptide) pyrophosphoryl-undecaprenol N-acetylglucosamine transferase
MAGADLVICRSGAMTLSELAVMGKASILIPSPNVTDDQQTKNAKLLSNAKAAVLIRESELAENSLLTEVEGLLSNERALRDMEERVKDFAVLDVEKNIVSEMKRVIEERSKKKG